jgi:hypothetical protein
VVGLDRCKAEVERRMRRYKRAPTLQALRRRLARFCGDVETVELVLTKMIRDDGTLRVANGLFYLREPLTLAELLETLDAPGTD